MAQTAQGPSAAPAPRRFDLNELRVEGNTVLPDRDIEAAVYDFLGPDKSADDVRAAQAALEKLYSDRGYATVSVQIPPQTPTDGVVVLQVVERSIGRTRVTGARYFDPSAVKAGAPSLAPGTIPNLQHVQDDIIALNQLPDRTVTPALRAGRTPDKVDVDLQVQDKFPLHGSLELNNQQSVDTTPLRLNGSLSYGNLWQRGDSANVSFQVAPQRPADATIVSGSYLFRIPDSQMSLLGSYVNSNSNVTSVGSSNVIGKGTIAGLSLLAPLGGSEGFSHSLSGGFAYKDLTQELGLGGSRSDAPVTYYPFTVGYQAGWTRASSSTDLGANIVLAFRGLGSSASAFDQQRAYGEPNFIYFRGDLAHTQELPYGLQAWGHAQAQLAQTPLLSSEQFSLGGVDTVRGYLESEALGDYGGSIQTELRSPPLARYIGGPLTSLRLHAFFDAGAAAINDALPGQTSSYNFSSTGFGARMDVLEHFHGVVDDAIVLSSGPNTRAGSNRVLFRIYGDF